MAQEKLPKTRESLTHKFKITASKPSSFDLVEYRCYLQVGFYKDGRVGEIFITIDKAGSKLRGVYDVFAIMTSLGLQNGVPLALLCDKFIGHRFEPSGSTTNPAIPRCTSPIDYIFRWLRLKFVPPEV